MEVNMTVDELLTLTEASHQIEAIKRILQDTDQYDWTKMESIKKIVEYKEEDE